MNLDFLDKQEYKDIQLLKMVDNKHGNLPFFIRKYSKKGFTTSLHRHEYMQINYVCQGNGKHLLNGHQFDILKGDIFVIPPYVPHCISTDENSNIEVFEFEFVPEFINESFKRIENVDSFLDFAYIEPFLVSESQVKPRLNLVGKLQVEAESILNEVLNEFTEKRAGFLLLAKSLLLKLLVLVGREFTIKLNSTEEKRIFSRHRDSILGAIKYIDENFSEDLNVEEVAKKFMLSQSYFSYLFKSITSKTFVEYLNGLRISKAMELLKITDKRVIDISYEAGFNNVNHFNRIFRQLTGTSPIIYRKNSEF